MLLHHFPRITSDTCPSLFFLTTYLDQGFGSLATKATRLGLTLDVIAQHMILHFEKFRDLHLALFMSLVCGRKLVQHGQNIKTATPRCEINRAAPCAVHLPFIMWEKQKAKGAMKMLYTTEQKTAGIVTGIKRKKPRTLKKYIWRRRWELFTSLLKFQGFKLRRP